MKKARIGVSGTVVVTSFPAATCLHHHQNHEEEKAATASIDIFHWLFPYTQF